MTTYSIEKSFGKSFVCIDKNYAHFMRQYQLTNKDARYINFYTVGSSDYLSNHIQRMDATEALKLQSTLISIAPIDVFISINGIEEADLQKKATILANLVIGSYITISSQSITPVSTKSLKQAKQEQIAKEKLQQLYQQIDACSLNKRRKIIAAFEA